MVADEVDSAGACRVATLDWAEGAMAAEETLEKAEGAAATAEGEVLADLRLESLEEKKAAEGSEGVGTEKATLEVVEKAWEEMEGEEKAEEEEETAEAEGSVEFLLGWPVEKVEVAEPEAEREAREARAEAAAEAEARGEVVEAEDAAAVGDSAELPLDLLEGKRAVEVSEEGETDWEEAATEGEAAGQREVAAELKERDWEEAILAVQKEEGAVELFRVETEGFLEEEDFLEVLGALGVAWAPFLVETEESAGEIQAMAEERAEREGIAAGHRKAARSGKRPTGNQ